LIAISVFLFVEAYQRLKNPVPVKGDIILIVAITGLIGNLFSALLIKKPSKNNLNIRAAYLHLVADTMSSVAVIIGGLIVYFFRIFWIDPLISVIIGLYIIRETFSILNETINILMQSTPQKLDLKLIKSKIEGLQDVHNIHHLHAWNLNDREIHFECHLDLDNNLTIEEATEIRRKINEILTKEFGIHHITIQFEYQCCKNKDMIFTPASQTKPG
jgi:cobalt-zinc-cadmium efflux system protein